MAGLLDTEVLYIHVKKWMIGVLCICYKKWIIYPLMAITKDIEDVLQGYIWIFLL